jgi:hypothetical protein
MDKKILILLPIWKRESITKICFDNLKELQKEFNIEVLCIVSEQWAKILAFEYGFKYVNASNECLGTKMNIGVRESLKYKYDYLMNLGSDDIITKELFNCYSDYFKINYPFFGGTRLTFINSASKEIKTCDYQVLIGAGRCIRRDELEKVLDRGEMYDKIQKGLDMNSMSKFICSMTEIKNPFTSIYDIKSDVNIWTYTNIGGTTIDFEKGVEGLSTKQIDNILEL